VNDLSDRTSKFFDRGSFFSRGEDKAQDTLMQANRGGEGIVSTHSQPRRKKSVGCQQHVPAVSPSERSGTACTGGWVGFGASLDGHRKLRPYRTVQAVAGRLTDSAVSALSLQLDYRRVVGLEG
jgi:hypothetical protein